MYERVQRLCERRPTTTQKPAEHRSDSLQEQGLSKKWVIVQVYYSYLIISSVI